MSSVIENPALTQNANNMLSGSYVKPRQISIKEYDSMIENGVFEEDENIELLNGVIVEKMPKGTKHATINDIIATRLIQKFGDKACVRNQNPIWLDDFSEPEPGIVLVKPPLEQYFDNHPTPNEIFLVIEIADSTLNYDRNTKSLAYSRAKIQQYLLLNVQDRTVEDYREPGADGYQSKQTYRAGQNFSLVAFPNFQQEVDDFLPVVNK